MSGFFFFFGDGLFTFVLPVYIRQLNASAINVGLLYAVYYLSWGVTTIIGGFWADRYDAKKIMIMNGLLWIPVPLALTFSTNWQQLWLPMILYGAFFEGPAVCVYILRSANSQKIMAAFGLWSASAAIGYIASPLIGGTLSSIIGKQTVFMVGFIFYCVSVLPLFFIRRQPKTESKESKPTLLQFKKKSLKSNKLIVLCIFFAATLFSIFLLNPFIPQFTHGVYHQTIFGIGVFGTSTAFGWIFFSFVLGKIGDKRSKMDAVVASISVSAFSFLIIISINNFALLCIASFLSGASNIIFYFMSGVIGEAAPEHLAGRWIAISQACVTFAGVGAPVLGGILYEISPYLAFTVTIIILSFLAVIGLARKI